MKRILFVDACMRGPEQSRAWRLCRTFLGPARKSWSGT